MSTDLAQLLLPALYFVVASTHAGTNELAWTVTGPFHANGESGIQGLIFSPNEDIQITALGWYDDTFSTGNGLSVSHVVGIFEFGSGTLLASATVPAGTTAPKTNVFRFVPIVPLPLTAGGSYVVAGVAAGDPGLNVTPGQTLTVNDRITLGSWVTAGGTQLIYPTTTIPVSTRRMGPCFEFRVADDDGDGVSNAEDDCPDTVTGAPVDAAGCPPPIPGDTDRDGDVDLYDIAQVYRCFRGPGAPVDPDCK